MSKEEAISKPPVGRVSRTPIGRRNILTVKGKDPNYVYRVVNDTGDRVQAFLDAGYELVKDQEVRVGDKRVDRTSAEGSISQLAVGQGVKAFVMRIKKEWYDEDQNSKQRYINEVEAATKAKALDGNYGNLEISRG